MAEPPPSDPNRDPNLSPSTSANVSPDAGGGSLDDLQNIRQERQFTKQAKSAETEYPSFIPRVDVKAVAPDAITVYASSFPPGEGLVARLGRYGTRGEDGVIVAEARAGSNGDFELTFPIPSELSGDGQLAVRIESASGFYAFNSFRPAAASPNQAAQAAPNPPPDAESQSDSATTANAPPERLFLTRRGSTRIYAFGSNDLSSIHVDGYIGFNPFYEDMDSIVKVLEARFSATGSPAEVGKGITYPEQFAPGDPVYVPLLKGQDSPAFLFANSINPARTGPAVPDAISLRMATAAAVSLAAEHRLHRLAVLLGPSNLEGVTGAEPPIPVGSAAESILRGIFDALPNGAIEEVTLVTGLVDAIEAAQDLLRSRIQRLSNDLVTGDDLLNIDAEVSALAEGLLLRELAPPLVVGVLGGWGSGKSFVMHLMQQHMAEIRSMSIPDSPPAGQAAAQSAGDGAFPYVGHVYLIRFDAWTYAKSNLWASLMQTIFYELNRQLSLERKLAEAGVDPRQGGQVWQLLYNMGEDRQQALLQDPLALEAFRKLQDTEISEDLLWNTLSDMKKEERERLHAIESELAARRQQLEAARAQLTAQVDQEIEEEARRQAWAPAQFLIQKLLGKTAARFKEQVESLPEGATETQPAGAAREGEAPSPSAAAAATSLQPGLGDIFNLARRNWVEFLAFALFFLLTLATPWILERLQAYRFPGGVLAFGSFVMAAMRFQEKWRRLLQDSFAAYQEQVRESRRQLEAGREQRINQEIEKQRAAARAAADQPETLAAQQNVPALEMQVQKLEAQAEGQRLRVGLTASTVSLADFVISRLDEDYYAKQLGLMHQVQRDLLELTSGLSESGEGLFGIDEAGQKAGEAIRQELFPRGPARIVLFIDDLDRCPPDKVVEVLEATQLLMKTSLFVVVLAMDVRFITRALEKSYASILTRKGRPSGLDYIEKIIQIPYAVRAIEPGSLPRFLGTMMYRAPARDGRSGRSGGGPSSPASGTGDGSASPSGGSPDAPSGQPSGSPSSPQSTASSPTPAPAPASRPLTGILPTRALEFSDDEFNFVQSCCRLIELTPRSVKRLVNVYKLLKIIWVRPNGRIKPPWPVEQGIVLLLALSGRYPDLMRDVLDSLRSKVEAGDASTFVDFFAAYPRRDGDAFSGQEWQRLLDDLKALMPPSLTLGQMGLDEFELVRSFSFVGDIGYEPGDYAARLMDTQRPPASDPEPESSEPK